MAQVLHSQLGPDAVAHPKSESSFAPQLPSLHHLSNAPQSHVSPTPFVRPIPNTQSDGELSEFDGLPPFPTDVPTAPLLRISLCKLLRGDEIEISRCWEACCEFGFFYLCLSEDPSKGSKSPEQEELMENVWSDHRDFENQSASTANGDVQINGEQLLSDAYQLFGVGEKFFDLDVSEKIKYDFAGTNSYYGYKGYGAGVIDSKGSRDRNEFFNVSKDDILGLSDPLPAPESLQHYRPLLKSYMQQSHAVVTFILGLLNDRLGLPANKLQSLHRLTARSGDQTRWIYAPPQPSDDLKTALGEHTDFGSVTILFNRLGGLQVLPPGAAEWYYVKPLKDHAIVNLGDALVKLTAGKLRSNIHRVVNPPGLQSETTRMALVYFARPEDDVLLKVLEGSEMIAESRKGKVEFNGESTETAKEWTLRRALGRRTGGNFAASHGTDVGRLEASK